MISSHVGRGVAAFLSCALLAPSAGAWDCSFKADPDRFLAQESRVRFAIHNTAKLARPTRSAAVDPADIPRRNFIDNFIFDAMAQQGVKSAPLSSDLVLDDFVSCW